MSLPEYDSRRIHNFSDAVFSIAITLLVLEVNVPSSAMIAKYSTVQILQSLIPSFIGLLVSFLVTALYWVAHMRISKYVRVYDSGLIWLNLFFLLFVIVLPFSTGFYVNVGIFDPFAFLVYCINVAALGLFHYLLTLAISKREKDNPDLTPLEAKIQRSRALIACIVWALTGLLAFHLPTLSRFIFLSIFIIQPLSKRFYTKRFEKKKAKSILAAQKRKPTQRSSKRKKRR